MKRHTNRSGNADAINPITSQHRFPSLVDFVVCTEGLYISTEAGVLNDMTLILNKYVGLCVWN